MKVKDIVKDLVKGTELVDADGLIFITPPYRSFGKYLTREDFVRHALKGFPEHIQTTYGVESKLNGPIWRLYKTSILKKHDEMK